MVWMRRPEGLKGQWLLQDADFVQVVEIAGSAAAPEMELAAGKPFLRSSQDGRNMDKICSWEMRRKRNVTDTVAGKARCDYQTYWESDHETCIGRNPES